MVLFRKYTAFFSDLCLRGRRGTHTPWLASQFEMGRLFRGLAHPGCKEIAHTALSFNAKQVLAPLLCYLYVIAFGIGNGTFIVAVACGAGIAQNCDAGSLESCSHIVNILPAAHRD